MGASTTRREAERRSFWERLFRPAGANDADPYLTMWTTLLRRLQDMGYEIILDLPLPPGPDGQTLVVAAVLRLQHAVFLLEPAGVEGIITAPQDEPHWHVEGRSGAVAVPNPVLSLRAKMDAIRGSTGPLSVEGLVVVLGEVRFAVKRPPEAGTPQEVINLMRDMRGWVGGTQDVAKVWLRLQGAKAAAMHPPVAEATLAAQLPPPTPVPPAPVPPMPVPPMPDPGPPPVTEPPPRTPPPPPAPNARPEPAPPPPPAPEIRPEPVPQPQQEPWVQERPAPLAMPPLPPVSSPAQPTFPTQQPYYVPGYPSQQRPHQGGPYPQAGPFGGRAGPPPSPPQPHYQPQPQNVAFPQGGYGPGYPAGAYPSAAVNGPQAPMPFEAGWAWGGVQAQPQPQAPVRYPTQPYGYPAPYAAPQSQPHHPQPQHPQVPPVAYPPDWGWGPAGPGERPPNDPASSQQTTVWAWGPQAPPQWAYEGERANPSGAMAPGPGAPGYMTERPPWGGAEPFGPGAVGARSWDMGPGYGAGYAPGSHHGHPPQPGPTRPMIPPYDPPPSGWEPTLGTGPRRRSDPFPDHRTQATGPEDDPGPDERL